MTDVKPTDPWTNRPDGLKCKTCIWYVEKQRQRIGKFDESQSAGIDGNSRQGALEKMAFLFAVRMFDQVQFFTPPRGDCSPNGWFRRTVLAWMLSFSGSPIRPAIGNIRG